MYRHGLGDCLLLRFARASGGTFNLLIDCGIIMVAQGAQQTMIDVAEDLKEACSGRIDVVVMTHEHWDHASGFSKDQAQAVFKDIEVGEVWYGWTEDPQNDLGKRLRKERADKVRALSIAASALARSPDAAVQLRADRLSKYLGFFGMETGQTLGAAAAIGRTREAFEYLMNRRGVKTRFLYPQKAPMSFPGVDNVRVYVLGPPQDESYIKKSAPSKKASEVYELATDFAFSSGLAAAFSRFGDPAASDAIDDCPFDGTFRINAGRKPRMTQALAELINEAWDAPQEQWRRIEADWTQAAETLALNLDSHTNNTCVVLAFEFSDTGEVFLFPADAQVGNWLSWKDLSWNIKSANGSAAKVRVSDLLSRTVFYKVGHHGSHNATLRELGLEQMTSEELVAFIPVIEAQAVKNRWMNMPFNPLLKRLKEKTGGRLLRSDKPGPAVTQLSELPQRSQKNFLDRIQQTPLFFEYSF